MARTHTTKAVRVLAPEEIRAGMYVTVHVETNDWFPAFIAACMPLEPVARLRWEEIPCEAGEVLQVVEVCVPYVLVRRRKGRDCTLDLRRVRLARLSKSFAKAAWRAGPMRPRC